MKLSKLLLISAMVSILTSLNAYASDNNGALPKYMSSWEILSVSDVRAKVYNPATDINKTHETVILVIGYDSCPPCKAAWIFIPRQLAAAQGIKYVTIRFPKDSWRKDISDFIIDMNKKATLKDAEKTPVPAIYIIHQNGNVVGTRGYPTGGWDENDNNNRYKDPDSHYHYQWPFVQTYNDLRYGR